MAKVLVVYYSRSGNTEKMANLVAEGARTEGVDGEIKKVVDTTPEDLLSADGIIVGSPTYYGLPAAEIKALFDESVKHHGRLSGKVGGAFSSAANIGGGNETTILAMLQMMLIHGMVVQGTAEGDHYGPVAINAPDDRSTPQCRALGKRVAELVAKLAMAGPWE
ncbi:MAG: flavodoxin family protein [Armatimonadota bacterium]